MPLTEASDLDDFLAGVPTTPADVEALDRARQFNHLDPHAYLAFLMAFAPQHPPDRSISGGQEPFTLMDRAVDDSAP